MATHSSVLAQRIPWTEEPGGLQSMGLQRIRYDLATSRAWPLCALLCTYLGSQGSSSLHGTDFSLVVVKLLSRVRLFATPWTIYSLPGSSVLGIFQARILQWVGHFLLQGIFPTQGLNPCLLCLLHWQVVSLAEPPGQPSKTTQQPCKYISDMYPTKKALQKV